MEVLKEIHEQFKSKDDFRTWMQKSFNVGEKTLSTDAYSIVATAKTGEHPDMTEKLVSIYPFEHNKNEAIIVSDLKDTIAKGPQTDEIEEINCKEFGEGEVEWTYDIYEIYDDCPVCNGMGGKKWKTGKKVFDSDVLLKIGGSHFKINLIERLLFVADKLGSDEIKLIHQTDAKHFSGFLIKDVEIILMPCELYEKKFITII